MKEIKTKIPDKPGVYFFLGRPKHGVGGKKGREILYIGKATSLKNRVKSYFGKDLIETRGPVLVDMVFQADKISYEATDTVIEALILEANLIKRYQPKYNTKEKSDTSFNYVCITKEVPSRVLLVRGKDLKPLNFRKVYGPYPSGSQLKEALKIIRRIFPFLDEKSKNYLEFYKQINLVPDLKDRKMYLQNIRNIKLFFEGKKKKIMQGLRKEMKEYAQKHEFEQAGEIKRQIFALKHINDVALIKKSFAESPPLGSLSPRPRGALTLGPSACERPRVRNSAYFSRIEAYDVAHMAGRNMVGVMTVIKGGEAVKNEYRKFKIKTKSNADDTGALAEVLERRLKHLEWTYPNIIVVDGGKAQINRARSVLKKAGLDIPVVSVLKDERHKPKNILGDSKLARKYETEIILANSEAHRFAITYHKKIRAKNFLQ